MSLTSYRAAPPRDETRLIPAPEPEQNTGRRGSLIPEVFLILAGPGGDLLFRGLSRSTIGAEGFHGRVRDGIGCIAPRHDHQAEQEPGARDQIRVSVFTAGFVAACDEYATIACAIVRRSSQSSD